MKKKYEAPQVEKIEFDYTETVVASYDEFIYKRNQNYRGCEDHVFEKWHGEASAVIPTCVSYPVE